MSDASFRSDAPFRHAFDAARDPMVARNALGIDSILTSSAASNAATYLTIANAATTYATIANFPAGAWTTWTPTITASSGTITSTSVSKARYIRHGKTVIAHLDFTITNAGTGAGQIQFTLPVSVASSGGGLVDGREVITGVALSGIVGSFGQIVKYDGTTVIATNNRPVVNAIYEGS